LILYLILHRTFKGDGAVTCYQQSPLPQPLNLQSLERNNAIETDRTAEYPNPEIGIHDFALSSHLWALRKIIIEPTGAT
jgi:hypothetical protein